MASLRKKYSTHIESQGSEPPVTAPPTAEPPPVVEPPVGAEGRPKPIEPIETQSPADAAASSAIKDRLGEMERAAKLAQQPPQPPQQSQHAEPQQQEMPAAVAEWLSRHPEYMDPTDPIAQAEIYTATLKASRDGLTWNDDNFLPAIERHRGLSNGHAETKPTPQPPSHAPARQAAPPQQPARQMVGPAVSAPPSRDVPSYSTGRSPRYRAPLNKDELEVAAASGMTAEQYQQQKERMLKMKAAGEIQG